MIQIDVLSLVNEGMATASNVSVPVKEDLVDTVRVGFHRGHLYHLSKAMK